MNKKIFFCGIMSLFFCFIFSQGFCETDTFCTVGDDCDDKPLSNNVLTQVENFTKKQTLNQKKPYYQRAEKIVFRASQGKAKVSSVSKEGELLRVEIEGANPNGENLTGWITKDNYLFIGQAFKGRKRLGKDKAISAMQNRSRTRTIKPKNNLAGDKKEEAEKIIKIMSKKIKNANGFMLFPDKNFEPSKKYFIFLDPACPYSRALFDLVKKNEDKVREKNIQIKWIPIAIMNNKSEIITTNWFHQGEIKGFKVSSKFVPSDEETIKNSKIYRENIDKNTLIYGNVLKGSNSYETPLVIWMKNDTIFYEPGVGELKDVFTQG